jgi:hypothetical protein
MLPSPGGLGSISIVGFAWRLTLQGRQGRSGIRPPLTALLVVLARGRAPVDGVGNDAATTAGEDPELAP